MLTTGGQLGHDFYVMDRSEDYYLKIMDAMMTPTVLQDVLLMPTRAIDLTCIVCRLEDEVLGSSLFGEPACFDVYYGHLIIMD